VADGFVTSDTVSSVSEAVTEAHRAEWGRIVSGLIRLTGDWALAEDAAQEAFATALERWPDDGIPSHPAAWLALTARNKAIDRLRSAGIERKKFGEIAVLGEIGLLGEIGMATVEHDIEDDRLRLIFTCCHPALPLPARVALTLRTVAGLTVAEIASAFLVPETTMAQRLVRARRKIENAGIPYRIPPAELLEERLDGVLAVLYLVFNEGYSSRSHLAASALDLASAVVDLMPRESEARGLLALMLLQNSRRGAREAGGELLTIEEQDRTLWDGADIRRGLAMLASARERGGYVLQASLAACHARASSAESTDWRRIVALYDELLARSPSPVVELNRAIAIGMRDGPDAGLALIDALEPRLLGFRLVPAAQADLLRRAGRTSAAAARYREALALTTDPVDHLQLERRLAQLPAVMRRGDLS
jgi:RNA polymerase sigma-70 factor (ECF subfamily)